MKTRTDWERSLFGDAYDGSRPFDRVKYGVMNVVNDPTGVSACSGYGDSILVLRNCRLRTTFANRDSGGISGKELAVA